MNHKCINPLKQAGITETDARALRRISMTLRRWHELECGDGRFAIKRDEVTKKPFRINYNVDPTRRKPISDREKDALKRLRAIMQCYPTLTPYVQTDPRGASLYILRPGDVPAGKNVESYYSRGIAVYK